MWKFIREPTRETSEWFAFIRRVVLFILGVLTIIDALTIVHQPPPTGELLTGVILLGLVPVEMLVDRVTFWPRRNGRNGRSCKTEQNNDHPTSD